MANRSETLWDLTPEAVVERVVAIGQPIFRAQQVLRWAYRRLAGGYEEMSDLPALLRQQLAEALPMTAPVAVAEQQSADGSTCKALLSLPRGDSVESVLMSYAAGEATRARNTVCISTQVGCAMGCVFCATGQQGFLRNLSSGEIVQQVLHFARALRQHGEHVTNVVFMGMGEPLANYDATLRSIETLKNPSAFGLGARRITISTVGLVPAIRRLASEGLQVGLAVSLHTPDDEMRRRLIPTARWPVVEILAAADEYTSRTGRRYTVEYALIERTNDSPELAAELARLVRGRPCHVNLIPVNPTANAGTPRSSRSRVLAFERVLHDAGINVTVRVEKGVDIAAGCGQLRGSEQGKHAGAKSEPLPLLAF